MPQKQHNKLLGDRVQDALKVLGITDERVSRLIGKPCRCGMRREWLNSMDLWARRVLSGKTQDAKKYFDDLMEGKK